MAQPLGQAWLDEQEMNDIPAKDGKQRVFPLRLSQ
jgi:hypothetical protein